MDDLVSFFSSIPAGLRIMLNIALESSWVLVSGEFFVFLKTAVNQLFISCFVGKSRLFDDCVGVQKWFFFLNLSWTLRKTMQKTVFVYDPPSRSNELSKSFAHYSDFCLWSKRLFPLYPLWKWSLRSFRAQLGLFFSFLKIKSSIFAISIELILCSRERTENSE